MAAPILADDVERCRCYWLYIGPLPVDPDAEATVAGCAIDTATGARLAHERLCATDFYDPRLWAVIEIAAHLPAEVPMFDRPDLVANRAAIPAATIHQLVTGRAVFHDRSGWHARRVKAAARARSEITALLDQLDELGVDLAPLLEDRPEVHA